MKVRIEREDKEISLKFEGTVNELLKQLNIIPETVLVVKNNDLLLKGDKIKNKDKIEILSVFSGG